MSFAQLMDELASMPLARRVECIADDVDSRTDRFAAIPAHELAELLDVPCPEQPDGNWHPTYYVEPCSVEDILDAGVGIEPLEKLIAPDRYKNLSSAFYRNELDYSVLSQEERECIVDADMKARLRDGCGQKMLAHFTVPTPDGRQLEFEGFIEDDGTCIDLLGPYDDREGRFRDLSDCLIGW